jgi:hypothetical protein
MKVFVFFLAALFSGLVTSCSSTKFMEYRGPNIVQGKGGTLRVVDGVDFWENGDPDRKYKILGVIDDSRGDGLISRIGKDSDIANKAKEYGGDAVIFIGSDRELRGVDLSSGVVHYRRVTKLLVVKYAE